MKTTTYARKPLIVDAVQVTEDNMLEVAKWCKGKIYEDKDKQMTIEVKVLHPVNADHTKAHAGDWVLKSPQGFKIYADSAFKKGFSELKDDVEADTLGEALRSKLADINQAELGFCFQTPEPA